MRSVSNQMARRDVAVVPMEFNDDPPENSEGDREDE